MDPLYIIECVFTTINKIRERVKLLEGNQKECEELVALVGSVKKAMLQVKQSCTNVRLLFFISCDVIFRFYFIFIYYILYDLIFLLFVEKYIFFPFVG